ncbi:hypothetical protein D3C84_1138630 [compost metagenome]
MPRLLVEYRGHGLAQFAQLQAPARAQAGHCAGIATQPVDLRVQGGQAGVGVVQFDLARHLASQQQEHAPGARQQQRQAIARIIEKALGAHPRAGL